jgi:hypothetical protein
MEPFYAKVVKTATSGQIRIEPEQNPNILTGLPANAVTGQTYSIGSRVICIWVGPFNTAICVLGVVQ